jgi:hypothetical protein
VQGLVEAGHDREPLRENGTVDGDEHLAIVRELLAGAAKFGAHPPQLRFRNLVHRVSHARHRSSIPPRRTQG